MYKMEYIGMAEGIKVKVCGHHRLYWQPAAV